MMPRVEYSRSWRLDLAGLVFVAPLIACAQGATSPSAVAMRTGVWGGEQVRLEVVQSGGQIEFSCAHATIDEPLVAKSDGTVDVAGRFVTEGGPTRDGPEQFQAVRLTGRVEGETFSFALTPVGSSASLGSFSATFGRTPRLTKCR